MEASERLAVLYDEVLAGIGACEREIGTRPVAVQWPHRGGQYGGTLILGQSVYGWADEWLASDFVSAARRRSIIDEVRARNRDRDDPMDWIATNSHRRSPFWSVCERLAETLEPTQPGPWHARIAWGNLYPAGPDDPPDNPRGPLREVQDAVVGRLLGAVVEMLDPRRVIVFGGPYWEPAGRDSGLDATLGEAERPLMHTGVVDGRVWVVGWHPTGASYRGFGPRIYAEIVREAIIRVESAGRIATPRESA
ncbi:MAG: hypothetical protein HY263_07475 [Chloroflexi bacterium]|nr:hypothetical protein [Chloroflexota bacterium]